MEIVLAAVVAAGVAVAVVMLVQRPARSGPRLRRRLRGRRRRPCRPQRSESREPVPVARDAAEEEPVARRTELARLEERGCG